MTIRSRCRGRPRTAKIRPPSYARFAPFVASETLRKRSSSYNSICAPILTALSQKTRWPSSSRRRRRCEARVQAIERRGTSSSIPTAGIERLPDASSQRPPRSFWSKSLFDKESHRSAPLLGRRVEISMQPMIEGVTRLMAGNDKPTTLLAKLESDDLDDAVLVGLAAVGRTEAHAAIWDRYAPLVRSIVRRSIRLESDVEDLVQEVFLQFYRSHTLMRNGEALRAFIFAISLHVTIREIRFRRARKRERLTGDGGHVCYSGVVPPADFEAREAVAGMRAMLDRLDPKDRTAFVLRHVEGLQLTEVAGMLDESLATVKRRLARIAHRVNAMTKNDQRFVEYLGER